jgi:hypothetical protein
MITAVKAGTGLQGLEKQVHFFVPKYDLASEMKSTHYIVLPLSYQMFVDILIRSSKKKLCFYRL